MNPPRPTPSTAAADITPTVRDAVVTEAVRLIEDAGPLDDAAALREAVPAPGGIAGRIAARASALGRRTGLDADIERAGRWAPWIGCAMVLAIVFMGLGLAGSVVGGSERRINVMAALLSLLGVHVATGLVWLAGLMLPWRTPALPHASLAWLWMAATARVAGGRQGQAPVLLRAATGLLARARLLPWAAGIASHAVWALSFAVVLGAMLFALAFHRYTLVWETTILDPGFFERAVTLLGRVPSWLGFPMPDVAGVLAPDTGGAASGGAAQRAWALWLTGCVVVYGLLPRLLALAVSLAVWRSRRAALAPDLSQPYYRRLAARFDALAPPDIVDADTGATGPARRKGAATSTNHPADGAPILAAFELPPDHPWPPAGEAAGVATVLRCDGSAQGRRELLDAVARLRPAVLVLAVRAASSPDRAIERLLTELRAHVGACALWLVPDATAPGRHEDGDGDDAALRGRWRQWLADTGLHDRIEAHDTLRAALPASPPTEIPA